MRPSLTALFVLAMVSGACSEDERDRAASEGAKRRIELMRKSALVTSSVETQSGEPEKASMSLAEKETSPKLTAPSVRRSLAESKTCAESCRVRSTTMKRGKREERRAAV